MIPHTLFLFFFGSPALVINRLCCPWSRHNRLVPNEGDEFFLFYSDKIRFCARVAPLLRCFDSAMIKKIVLMTRRREESAMRRPHEM